MAIGIGLHCWYCEHGPCNGECKEKEKAPAEIIINVKSWKQGDEYECPNCNAKIGTNKENKYICEPCNIRIKPVINW